MPAPAPASQHGHAQFGKATIGRSHTTALVPLPARDGVMRRQGFVSDFVMRREGFVSDFVGLLSACDVLQPRLHQRARSEEGVSVFTVASPELA